MDRLDSAIANARSHLLALRNEAGHWEGELSSSALSTATAIVALTMVDAEVHRERVARGTSWLLTNQHADGGWGDTTISKSNLSTTLLVWSALHLAKVEDGVWRTRADAWILERTGSLEPRRIAKAVIARYGKDKTFSVPILMLCAICGKMGSEREAWRLVLALPFELAALPRQWFGAVGLPVVSYALPALIAIGYARFYHCAPAWWNPLRWLRGLLWPRIRPMLRTLQPSTGGYLEATPLTSFVTMALASADQKHHPCVPEAVRFLIASERPDGSWPIDTNLATWVTTGAVRALAVAGENSSLDLQPVTDWLIRQQYQVIHPFTNAAPGAWAWTDLPGGVPDADDTSGALIALSHLLTTNEQRLALADRAGQAVTWLLDLQNRDGGVPTFCRGWGTLPFDRSTPEITAHAMLAWSKWEGYLPEDLRLRIDTGRRDALRYLAREQKPDGSWVPLWFGNEHAEGEENPVHGTSMVVMGLSEGRTPLDEAGKAMLRKAVAFLLECQDKATGCWGAEKGVPGTIEETANALQALIAYAALREQDLAELQGAVRLGTNWLLEKTQEGTAFEAAPVGLYFARLWYHEEMYPIIWTLASLARARKLLAQE